MNAKIIFPLITFFFLGIGMIKGQDCQNIALIQKIDSISKAKNIKIGLITFHQITSIGESTVTESFNLSRKQEFSFDGPYLVMGENYFNMNKLLYFFIRKDHIEFYFQGY